MALVFAAIGAAWLPTSPRVVERWYSNGWYAALQRPLTGISNLVPYACFDLLLIVALGGWLYLSLRDVRRRGRRGAWRTVGRISARTVVLAAGSYLAFLLLWGLNYRRVPLIERLPFDAHAVTSDAARALALTATESLNTLYTPAHAAGWPSADAVDASLAASLGRVQRQVGGRGDLVVGRPKHTLLDWYFRRTAVQGMTDPYFLETLVSTDLLPFERPFVVAHEWSHLAGLADEGDANFLGWLACVQGTPPEQYSGWLFLYSEVVGAIRGPSRTALVARLDAGPRADLEAIRDRLIAQVSPRLSTAGWLVYDQYLKANRVDGGAESYGHVVRLVLGVRFGAGWIPQATVP